MTQHSDGPVSANTTFPMTSASEEGGHKNPPLPEEYVVVQDRWKHRKGSTYMRLGEAQAQTTQGISDYDRLVVYRSEEDGSLWVRPYEEFHDGRFERISAPPQPVPSGWLASPTERLSRDRDIILEAINEYDAYMLDDDYDAHSALRQIIERMRDRAMIPTPPQHKDNER